MSTPNQPQMSQEEIDKTLRRFKLDRTRHVDAMFGEHATQETRMAALQEIISGVREETLTAAELLGTKRLGDFEGKYKQVWEGSQQMLSDRQWEKFYKQHPELEKFEELVQSKFTSVQASMAADAKPKDFLEKLASESYQAIKNINPTFEIPASATPQTTSTPPTTQPTGTPRPNPEPASTSSGSQSTAPGGSSLSLEKQAAASDGFD